MHRSNSGGDVATPTSELAADGATSPSTSGGYDESVRVILGQQRKESASSLAAPIGPEEAEMLRARVRRREAVSFHSHESNGGGGGGEEEEETDI